MRYGTGMFPGANALQDELEQPWRAISRLHLSATLLTVRHDAMLWAKSSTVFSLIATTF
jgi:hypothetical protein